MDKRINDEVLSRILGSECDMPACNIVSEASDRKATTWGLKNYPLAMVYAPLQEFDDLHDLDCALRAGTIFKELELPFMGLTVTKGGTNCRG